MYICIIDMWPSTNLAASQGLLTKTASYRRSRHAQPKGQVLFFEDLLCFTEDDTIRARLTIAELYKHTAASLRVPGRRCKQAVSSQRANWNVLESVLERADARGRGPFVVGGFPWVAVQNL